MLQIFLLSLIALAYGDSLFKLYKHPVNSSARCVDGSPAAFYIQQGGGACGGMTLTDTLENCYQRAQSDYGSSKGYNQVLDLSVASALSANFTLNPNFFDWTRVFIPYCDGSFHQGSRANPINYKGLDMYFRGANNTLAHLQYLRTAYNMQSASQIVVSGASAGAMATFYWANFIQEQFKNSKVIAIPDSGIFVASFINPLTNTTGLDNLVEMFKLVNTQVQMPMKQCLKVYPSQRQCFQAGVIAPFLKVPTFIVQSLYDVYELKYILGYSCVQYKEASNLQSCNSSVRLAIEAYRKATQDAISNFTSNLDNIGVWAISCAQHVFTDDDSLNSDNYLVPSKTGLTAAEAIGQFLANQSAKSSNIHIDSVQWPNNIGCSGVTQRFGLLQILNE